MLNSQTTSFGQVTSISAVETTTDGELIAPPDDILTDSTLKARTFAVSRRSGFRAAVTLGRLARFHALLLPGVPREYAESIGNLIGVSWARTDFSGLLERVVAAQRAATEKEEAQAVLFEHGNGSVWPAARYGTHIAHMHCMVTLAPELFKDHLLGLLDEDGRWFRVRGWASIETLAEAKVEYMFFQVGDDAWAREVDNSSAPPRQYLRQIAFHCLRAADECLSDDWLWRSANDQSEAVEDAVTLRALLPTAWGELSESRSS